jgi:ubiquinone/menaquinone biosynthesis C-methylase UbiE
MDWLDLPRVPEPEVMDEAGEVEAYSSAAAQTYLSAIDDTFVSHALKLVTHMSPAKIAGTVLDIGTGPGQIAMKVAERLPGWLIVAVDRAPNMIREALTARRSATLPFADHSFDLVLCNSVLHHFENPAKVLAEIARVARSDGAILVRDISRPSRIAYALHARWFGRHYSGTMYQLYCDSLRSAYTLGELSAMLRQSPLRDAHVFRRGRTHIGIERDAS